MTRPDGEHEQVVQGQGEACQRNHARAARHAHGGREPHRCRRCEPADRVIVDEDDSGSQEADPGDDLGRNARGIDARARSRTGAGPEPVGRHEGEQAGPHAHQDMRLDAGVFEMHMALEAEQQAQAEGRA